MRKESESTPLVGKQIYMAGLAAFALVLAGYVWTLAPTVTFWDAGEFIAAAKILGVPHPPGTPVFILLAHVWADIVRIGEYAYRTNLMTAVFSAAGAGLFFLLVARTLQGRAGGKMSRVEAVYSLGGAGAGVAIAAFAFTVWQNSNETEVYMVSAFSIAAMCWLGLLWRGYRGTTRASHLLLLVLYLQAFSVGNHLLALLVGPAILGFMLHVIRTEPLENQVSRRIEFAQWTVMAGTWALLVGTGLGSTTLLTLATIVFVVAAVYATVTGAWRFSAMALFIAGVGVSTYYFIYIRAGLQPFINEADPSTWESLLSVIRREQYPPRAPWDNPIYSGSHPLNDGRSLGVIWLQILQYLQYYDWQWSKGLAPTQAVFASIRMPFTLLFTSLGIYGASTLREKDRSVFWLLMLLFLATGPGLVGYMNFKPGFSLGWDQFAQASMHEVRERDYFFTVSYLVWGLFAGIGLAGIFKKLTGMIRERSEDPAKVGLAGPSAIFLIGLLPFALNFNAASRAHGPEATLAKDFAYDLLQTVEPYGIIFTNGDNDTFPLWHAQEVAEVRRDVAVVNLSLGNTEWYIRQLRDNPVREFDPEQAPWFADLAPANPPGRLHSWTDAEILSIRPQSLQSPLVFSPGLIDMVYPVGTELYTKDVLVLRLIQENWETRPIYFSVTAGSGNWMGLQQYMTQEALAIRLHAKTPPDTSGLVQGFLSIPVNLSRTDSLVWGVYRYSTLLEQDSLDLSPTENNIATNLSIPFLTLGQAYMMLGDPVRALENFDHAYLLSPSPQLAGLIRATRSESAFTLFGDTTEAGDSAVSGDDASR